MKQTIKYIKGTQNRYAVDNQGNVYSFTRKNPHIMKPVYSKSKGCYCVGFHLGNQKYKFHTVARLVYEYFKGEIPDDRYIVHIDGNIQNNHINNLKLSDNKSRSAKIDANTAKSIRILSNSYTAKEIAIMLNISYQIVWNVLANKTWTQQS